MSVKVQENVRPPSTPGCCSNSLPGRKGWALIGQGPGSVD